MSIILNLFPTIKFQTFQPDFIQYELFTYQEPKTIKKPKKILNFIKAFDKDSSAPDKDSSISKRFKRPNRQEYQHLFQFKKIKDIPKLKKNLIFTQDFKNKMLLESKRVEKPKMIYKKPKLKENLFFPKNFINTDFINKTCVENIYLTSKNENSFLVYGNNSRYQVSNWKKIVTEIKKDLLKSDKPSFKFGYNINKDVDTYNFLTQDTEKIKIKLNYDNISKNLEINFNELNINLPEFERFLNIEKLSEIIPPTNNLEFELVNNLEYKDFKRVVDIASKTISKDFTKLKLVKYHFNRNYLVTLDSFMLSKNFTGISDNFTFNLTQDQMKELVKDNKGKTNIKISKSLKGDYVKFELTGSKPKKVCIFQVDADFIQYKSIFKNLKDYKYKLNINIKEFETVLKTMKPSLSKKTPLIKISNIDNKLIFESNDDNSRFSTSLNYKSEKPIENFSIVLSARFLNPMLISAKKNRFKNIDMYIEDNQNIVTFDINKDCNFIMQPMDVD